MKLPAVGQEVTCPTDRGSPAYKGTVIDVGSPVPANRFCPEFAWVQVKADDKTAVWPSHRLDFKTTVCNQLQKGAV